jgi:hypothetical protein
MFNIKEKRVNFGLVYTLCEIIDEELYSNFFFAGSIFLKLFPASMLFNRES